MRGLSLILHALWIVCATAKFTEPVSSNEDFYQIWSVGTEQLKISLFTQDIR